MTNVQVKAMAIVLVVCLLAALLGVGYVAGQGTAAHFAPEPSSNKPRGNQPPPGNAEPRRAGDKPAVKPIPDDESVWEDYPAEKLDYEPRLPERPGNFDVVTRVGQFYEGLYAVEPRFTGHAAYPLTLGRDKFESAEAFEAQKLESEAEDRKSGRKQKNKLREFNVIINGLTIQRFAPGEAAIANPKEKGMRERDIETFATVRKAHPERCCLVFVDVQLESLQSDKIEHPGDAGEIFCYVQKADGWKLVWWQGG